MLHSSFFETSKLWTIIYYSLVGLQCLGLGQSPRGLQGPLRALPKPPSTRLGCQAVYILYIFSVHCSLE